MNVTVNGRAHAVSPGTLLVEFLEGQGVDTKRIALERNRELVPRAQHAGLVMSEGDTFEVVHFVGGG